MAESPNEPITPPPAEEWLPIESWLVGGSIILGITLLGLLIWLTKFFPA